MRDLHGEVVEFLRRHGPSTGTEIALGVRARRADVDALLAGDGFSRVAKPDGAAPRSVYYDVSRVVPVRRGGKSRAAAMLDVLGDGRRHSRDEIFHRAGRFFLTNNAAAELRAAGYDVRHGRDGGVDVYWLAGRLAEPEATSDAAFPSEDSSGSASDRLFDGESRGAYREPGAA